MNPQITSFCVTSSGAFLRTFSKSGIALACLCLASFSYAEVAPAALVTNSNFETAGADGTWPDGWTRPKTGEPTWETEEGGRFLRLKTTAPGQTLLVHRLVQLYPDVKAVEISVRARVSELVTGTKPWFDARIMTGFKNQEGAKVKSGAKAIAFRKDTGGWVERKVSFLVPEGAVVLEIMPTLMEVETGIFDIDDLTVTPIDPAALESAASK